MIIKNSAIQLNSQHQSSKSTKESESLRFWKTQERPAEGNRLSKKEQLADIVSLSKPAQTLKPAKQSLDLGEAPDSNHSMMLLIVRIVKITGWDFKLFSPDD
jgi:hypothetical protein